MSEKNLSRGASGHDARSSGRTLDPGQDSVAKGDKRATITLRGGPFDRMEAAQPDGRSLIIWDEEHEKVPEGKVARYRPGREKGAYTFRGLDELVGLIPRG